MLLQQRFSLLKTHLKLKVFGGWLHQYSPLSCSTVEWGHRLNGIFNYLIILLLGLKQFKMYTFGVTCVRIAIINREKAKINKNR